MSIQIFKKIEKKVLTSQFIYDIMLLVSNILRINYAGGENRMRLKSILGCIYVIVQIVLYVCIFQNILIMVKSDDASFHALGVMLLLYSICRINAAFCSYYREKDNEENKKN